LPTGSYTLAAKTAVTNAGTTAVTVTCQIATSGTPLDVTNGTGSSGYYFFVDNLTATTFSAPVTIELDCYTNAGPVTVASYQLVATLVGGLN
jgi:hypothetical protein